MIDLPVMPGSNVSGLAPVVDTAPLAETAAVGAARDQILVHLKDHLDACLLSLGDTLVACTSCIQRALQSEMVAIQQAALSARQPLQVYLAGLQAQLGEYAAQAGCGHVPVQDPMGSPTGRTPAVATPSAAGVNGGSGGDCFAPGYTPFPGATPLQTCLAATGNNPECQAWAQFPPGPSPCDPSHSRPQIGGQGSADCCGQTCDPEGTRPACCNLPQVCNPPPPPPPPDQCIPICGLPLGGGMGGGNNGGGIGGGLPCPPCPAPPPCPPCPPCPPPCCQGLPPIILVPWPIGTVCDGTVTTNTIISYNTVTNTSTVVNISDVTNILNEQISTSAETNQASAQGPSIVESPQQSVQTAPITAGSPQVTVLLQGATITAPLTITTSPSVSGTSNTVGDLAQSLPQEIDAATQAVGKGSAVSDFTGGTQFDPITQGASGVGTNGTHVKVLGAESSRNTEPEGFRLPTWCNDDICTEITSVTDALGALLGKGPLGFLDLLKDDGEVNEDNWLATALDFSTFSLKDITNDLLRLVNWASKIATSTTDCNKPRLVVAHTAFALISWLSDKLGLGFDRLKTSAGNWRNWACPDGLPSTGDAVSAYNSGIISQPLYRCIMAANNVCQEWADRQAVLGRIKLSTRAVAGLVASGTWDQPQADLRLTESGHFDTVERYYSQQDQLDRLNWGEYASLKTAGLDQFPTIARYGLEEGFPLDADTYARDVRRQGAIDTTTAAYRWYQHWRFPPLHQQWEATLRLKPGTVPDAIATPTTVIDDALIQAQVPPYWRDRLKALLQPQIPVRQARTLYTSGAITLAELTARYQRFGYSDEDATALGTSAYLARSRQCEREADVKRYVAYELSENTLRRRLTAAGYDGTQIQGAVRLAQAEQQAAAQRACVAAVRRRFLTGEFPAQQIAQYLQALDLENQEIVDLARRWYCELLGRSKEQSASTLCRWYTAGVISATEYAVRLAAIGYYPADVNRIMAECVLDAQQKATLQSVKAAKAAAAAAAKAAAAKQRAADKAAKAAATTAAKAVKAARAAEKQGVRRIKIAEAIVSLMSSDLNTAKLLLDDSLGMLQAQYHMSLDGALDAMDEVVKQAAKDGQTDYHSTLCDQLARTHGHANGQPCPR